MPPNLHEPPAKFAKVLVRDENGIEKHVLIPANKLNLNANPAKVRLILLGSNDNNLNKQVSVILVLLKS